eukprot:IDg3356t1
MKKRNNAPLPRPDEMFDRLGDAKFFSKICPIIKAMEGVFPTDEVQKDWIERLLIKFKMIEGMLYYEGMVCVPRRCVRDVLQLAHDPKLGGHFAFAKTLARVKQFQWKGKTKDVRKYYQGRMTCQQQRDLNSKRLGEPVSLNIPTRRWGCKATDFIIGLPVTKNGFDEITTWCSAKPRRAELRG